MSSCLHLRVGTSFSCTTRIGTRLTKIQTGRILWAHFSPVSATKMKSFITLTPGLLMARPFFVGASSLVAWICLTLDWVSPRGCGDSPSTDFLSTLTTRRQAENRQLIDVNWSTMITQHYMVDKLSLAMSCRNLLYCR